VGGKSLTRTEILKRLEELEKYNHQYVVIRKMRYTDETRLVESSSPFDGEIEYLVAAVDDSKVAEIYGPSYDKTFLIPVLFELSLSNSIADISLGSRDPTSNVIVDVVESIETTNIEPDIIDRIVSLPWVNSYTRNQPKNP
jgi:hypothetical protein